MLSVRFLRWSLFGVVTSLMHQSPCAPALLSLVRHIYHCPIIISHPLWGFRCRKFFLFISVVVFMLTLPLHELMIPLFFVFFLIFFYLSKRIFLLHFYPTNLSPPLFYFVDFVFFLTTASWNRSGWHPRSLTGQCTSHLPLPLPLFLWSCSSSTFSPPFPAFLQHSVVPPLNLCFHPSTRTLLHPYVYLCYPPSSPFSPSLSTHSFLFQTTISSNLIWV